jgi:malate dehydrogenase (oxaloacetate-decarboxylating)
MLAPSLRLVRHLRLSATTGEGFPSPSAITSIYSLAIGLGVVASGARRVTDPMILAAARALAENSPALHDASASLLPALTDLRKVAVQIATAVGLEAQRAGVAPKTREEKLREQVKATQWTPAYTALK